MKFPFCLHKKKKSWHQDESEFFRAFLDGLCVLFYDTVRPLIINLQHLETLSELTSILRTEMLEHHCMAAAAGSNRLPTNAIATSQWVTLQFGDILAYRKYPFNFSL